MNQETYQALKMIVNIIKSNEPNYDSMGVTISDLQALERVEAWIDEVSGYYKPGGECYEEGEK